MILKRKPTIQDIAETAQVGRGTVSRVLNNHPNVSQETRDRVLAAINELEYRPRFAARHMRTQKSHLIGFLSDEVATTPYAGSIIQGAQEAAWVQERMLLVISVGKSRDMVEAAVETLLEREVEGIIYAAMYHQPVELPETIKLVPTVLANCFAADRSLPSVVPDEITGGYTATKRLLQAGHRRIGFINVFTLNPGIPASVGRWEGYCRALAEYGLEYDEALVRHGHGSAETGYAYTLEMMGLSEPPTAIFCGNDRTALGAYNALAELSLRVPHDVAIIGFDNQEIIAAALRPPLTTMQLPHYEMGEWATQYLMQYADSGEELEPIQHLLTCPLVERQSI